MTMPAAMSATKWLPVATTARQTVGPHSQAAMRHVRLVAAAARAAPTATAKPACRLGTAAYWL